MLAAGLNQPPHLRRKIAAGLADVGNHLLAGLRASRHLRHFSHDVGGAGTDDHQVIGAYAAGGQEAIDLLRHRGRRGTAGGIGLGDDAGVAGGKGGASGSRRSQRHAESGSHVLGPDVDAIVIHGVAATANLAQIGHAVAEGDDARGLQLRLDVSRTAGGHEQGRSGRQRQQDAALPVK